MPKISKNIKKLRAEHNLTQEALAEKIHVTRQAISSWENDKTKPDIEALESLAQAFGVDIEEIIYGEKKEIIISQEKTTEKNRIKVILAIIGSLLVASGLALVFFGFWQNFSIALQTVFAIVPMLLGQGVAIFTQLKKKESVSWRESAAIIWSVGIIVTIALLNGIHNINLGYINCLAIDAFLIIPIMYLFKAVSPLVFLLYASVHIGMDDLWQYLLISVIIYVFTIGFTVLLRKKEDTRAVFAQWILVFASLPLIWIYNAALYKAGLVLDSGNIFIALYLVVFLCMYIFSADKTSNILPYRIISIIGLCATTSFLSEEFYNEYLADGGNELVVSSAVICIAVPIVAGLIKRRTFENNVKKILISALPIAIMITNFAYMFIIEFMGYFSEVAKVLREVLIIGTNALVFAFGVVLVYAGIKELRLFPINVGLITAFIRVIRLFENGLLPDSYLLKGIIIAIFGVIIIVINWKMLSVKKNIQEQQEVDENA